MKRNKIQPRENYIKKIENIGFNFHTDYWKENSYYEFSKKEIETIEKATSDCYSMYCDAAQYVIDNNLFSKLMIPEHMAEAIMRTWDKDHLSLYGRFDFAIIDGVPKLMEFNGDTPTSLLEASIIQWNWKEDLFPKADQFNSLHEVLVQSWKDIAERYGKENIYYFAGCRESVEDSETLEYLLSTAHEAGLDTAEIDMDQLLFDDEDGSFYAPSGDNIGICFKLYPWEWMWNECPNGINTETIFIEPQWKALMSNKAMLPILYELFPDSPYILKCYKDEPKDLVEYCKKPIFGREGSNVTLCHNNSIYGTSGDYGSEGFVYQEFIDLPKFDERYPIIGSWVIGGESCGMGIRETNSRITDNLSEFIPHIIID